MTNTHLPMISLAPNHGPLDHFGEAVRVVHGDGLLWRPFDRHLLSLHSISRRVLTNHLPRDLKTTSGHHSRTTQSTAAA